MYFTSNVSTLALVGCDGTRYQYITSFTATSTTANSPGGVATGTSAGQAIATGGTIGIAQGGNVLMPEGQSTGLVRYTLVAGTPASTAALVSGGKPVKYFATSPDLSLVALYDDTPLLKVYNMIFSSANAITATLMSTLTTTAPLTANINVLSFYSNVLLAAGILL